MKVTFITTVKNEEGTIRDYLEALGRQTRKPDEVVIVDAQSVDRTVEHVRACEPLFANLRLIVRPCNIAEGRNIAVREANGDVIAMSDAGCVLEENWLDELCRPFEVDPGVEIVAGNWNILDEPGLPRFLRWYFLRSRPDFADGPSDTLNPSGRSCAVRRDTWLRLNGHPEFLYAGEDTLFNRKWRSHEVRAVFAAGAIAAWRMHRTLRPFGRQVFGYARANGRLATAGGLREVVYLPREFACYALMLCLLVASALLHSMPSLLVLATAMALTATAFIRWRLPFYVQARRYGFNIRESVGAVALSLYADFRSLCGTIHGLRDRMKGDFEQAEQDYLVSSTPLEAMGNENRALAGAADMGRNRREH